MIISLEEAKNYLRIDTGFEDSIIEQLIKSAENICADVARLTVEDFQDSGETAKIAVLYTLGYLYENRTDADFSKLAVFLRSILYPFREGAPP